MKNTTEFIADFNQFNQSVINIMDENIHAEFLISGDFNNAIYKEILYKIKGYSNLSKCKIIIPYVSGHGIISRSYINRTCEVGCQYRINSRFNKNLLLVGEYAFLVSSSYKYNRKNEIRNYFSCCMITNEKDAVMKMHDLFTDAWDESILLVYE